ncbi:MAG: hypothetical protein L0215_14155 [Gemmataceae bacterium]|nr:hypothetical protein [Gemmataceae bacterium]
MGHTADVFNVTYDDNYVIGLGYQCYPWSAHNFHLGGEIGLANRFGDAYTAEVWAGPTLRYDGIRLADLLRITPSMTAGFSAVTESMGHERVRENAKRGEASFLFYLGPEIAVSSPAYSNIEVFYRLHHRCGGHRTLGHLSEGYNANVVGLRLRY